MNVRDRVPGLTLSSSPPEYPDPTDDEINARMDRIEKIARADIVDCTARFKDWLAEYNGDQLELAARMISYSFDQGEPTGKRQCAFWACQGLIEADYRAYLDEQESV
jgi:hypothetical protein